MDELEKVIAEVFAELEAANVNPYDFMASLEEEFTIQFGERVDFKF